VLNQRAASTKWPDQQSHLTDCGDPATARNTESADPIGTRFKTHCAVGDEIRRRLFVGLGRGLGPRAGGLRRDTAAGGVLRAALAHRHCAERIPVGMQSRMAVTPAMPRHVPHRRAPVLPLVPLPPPLVLPPPSRPPLPLPQSWASTAPNTDQDPRACTHNWGTGGTRWTRNCICPG